MAGVVRKVTACLEAIASTPGGLTGSEVAACAGLSRPAVTRILEGLASDLLIIRDGRTKKFRLGLRLHEWSTRAIQSTTPVSIARKEMIHLTQELHRPFNFLVLESNDVVALEGTEWMDGQALTRPTSARCPWYETASGKAIAAFSPNEVTSGLLSAVQRKLSPNAANLLASELDIIRQLGHADTRGEFRAGVFGLGVPVREYTGFAVGAIGTYTLEEELDPVRVGPLLASISATATRVSSFLGYQSPLHAIIT